MANTLSSRIDGDKLNMVSRDRVANVAHELLHGANHRPAEELSAGVAVLFYAVAERNGMEPEQLYHLGRKILMDPAKFHTKSNVQMEALRDFAGLRVRNESAI